MKFPTAIGPYRLWKQDERCGYYQIKPEAQLAIWHVADEGWWAMVAGPHGWKPLNTDPLPKFWWARNVIQGYCKRHGLEEEVA